MAKSHGRCFRECRTMVAITLALILCGCGDMSRPKVPVIDVSDIPEKQLKSAYRVRVFTADGGAKYPEIAANIEHITAYSCQLKANDPPASKGDALIQLRLYALELGADGIIDVTFDTRGADALGTNCWESVQASGIAVRFK